VKPGDYVKREWKSGAPTQYGIVLELHMRSAEYPNSRIKRQPIRTLMVLQSDGKIKKWFGVHTEVINEGR
jgi:hypothetical protein